MLFALVALIGGPLRPGHADRELEATESARAELEAARDAKYRQIREVELDYRTGKLEEADWRAQDRVMRGEAIDILRRLDEVDGDAVGTAA